MTALAVQAGGHRVALPLAAVEEVVEAAALTPEGRLDVHGVELPVVDLSEHLGLPPRPLRVRDHFVLLRSGADRLALRVDHAEELVEVAPDELLSIDALRP